MYKKIVLIGYMGSGKTAVGTLLAQKMGVKFSDLDDFISEKEGESIPTIFNTKGEIHFRKIERTYLKELLETDEDAIISLGGGTPCYGDNMKQILENKNTISIYLSAQPETLVERLFSHHKERPLISHLNNREELLDFIRKHLFERKFFYAQAHFQVNTDGKNLRNIVDEIVKRLFK